MTIEYDIEKFYAGLVRHGLIIPVGVQGAFGRCRFLRTFSNVSTGWSRMYETRQAKGVHFSSYYQSPGSGERSITLILFHICAVRFTVFLARSCRQRRSQKKSTRAKPWKDMLGMTDVVLNPAACYPVYPSFTGVVPKGGRLVTMLNWVFRHEPSPEPTRMQSFRVREFVKVGTPRRGSRMA